MIVVPKPVRDGVGRLGTEAGVAGGDMTEGEAYCCEAVEDTEEALECPVESAVATVVEAEDEAEERRCS